MADEIIIETVSAEVIEVGQVGPQGPKGDKGDPGDVAGLPLTTQGDSLYRGASQNERLPIGTAGQILRVSASGVPEWGSAPASGVSSVNGESGAVTLDGSEIDTSGNNDEAAFFTYEFADGNGLYYPLPDSTLNNKRVYRTTTGHHVFFESLRWHITDGAPITANIVESSDNDNAAWPWLSAWGGSIEKAQLSTVVGRARSTFLFVGDSIPNTSVSGLAAVAASGDYDDLTGKPASFTPSAHSSTHHTGGTDAIAPNQISAQWALETRAHSFNTTSTYTLAQGRNVQLNVGSVALNVTGTITLPRLTTDSAQNGDDLFIVLANNPSSGGSLVIQRYIWTGSSYINSTETVVTATTSGAWRFRQISGVWVLQPVATHTHPSTQITGLGTAATADSTDFAAASHTHELDELDATGATLGHVLTADGSNGASWQAASGGGGASLMQSIAVGFVLN